jgi:hypothetical protein
MDRDPFGRSFRRVRRTHATAGTVPWTAVQRGIGSGSNVLFDNALLPSGQTTTSFFIHTNATTFNALGTATITADPAINGAAVFTNIFEPANIPEPAAATGAAVLILLGCRRRSRS